MNFNANIPTIFAKELAETSGIIVKPQIGMNHSEYSDKVSRLKAFQQMALMVEFDEAMIAFHGQELDEEQKGVLQVIYSSTKPWILGHVVGELLDKCSGDMKAAELILQKMNPQEENEGNRKPVEFTVVLANDKDGKE